MRALRRKGLDVGIWSPREGLGAGTTLAVDAWTLFPTHSNPSALDILSLVRNARVAGCQIVLDNCDNQFAASAPTPQWSSALQLLREVAAQAHQVVCCSHELARQFERHVTTAARYSVIDDPIEDAIWYPDDAWWRSLLSPARKVSWLKALQHAAALSADRRTGRTPLVWFGSQGNGFAPGGMLDLLSKKELLESANRSHPISLAIISNSRQKFARHFRNWSFPVRYLDWDRETFISILKRHEISLLPSVSNDFTNCKSSNRLVHSLIHGLSVLADPVPSYLSFGEHARIGDWANGLDWLLRHPEGRRSQVKAGQVALRLQYSIGAIAAQWESVFLDPR